MWLRWLQMRHITLFVLILSEEEKRWEEKTHSFVLFQGLTGSGLGRSRPSSQWHQLAWLWPHILTISLLSGWPQGTPLFNLHTLIYSFTLQSCCWRAAAYQHGLLQGQLYPTMLSSLPVCSHSLTKNHSSSSGCSAWRATGLESKIISRKMICVSDLILAITSGLPLTREWMETTRSAISQCFWPFKSELASLTLCL